MYESVQGGPEGKGKNDVSNSEENDQLRKRFNGEELKEVRELNCLRSSTLRVEKLELEVSFRLS